MVTHLKGTAPSRQGEVPWRHISNSVPGFLGGCYSALQRLHLHSHQKGTLVKESLPFWKALFPKPFHTCHSKSSSQQRKEGVTTPILHMGKQRLGGRLPSRKWHNVNRKIRVVLAKPYGNMQSHFHCFLPWRKKCAHQCVPFAICLTPGMVTKPP